MYNTLVHAKRGRVVDEEWNFELRKIFVDSGMEAEVSLPNWGD